VGGVKRDVVLHAPTGRPWAAHVPWALFVEGALLFARGSAPRACSGGAHFSAENTKSSTLLQQLLLNGEACEGRD
jgi:hypothetical protein